MNKLQTAHYNTYALRIKHPEENKDITKRAYALVTARQSDRGVVDPYSRKIKISGSVKQDTTGAIITGAVIKVVNADLNSITDEEGNFTLDIPQTGTIAVTVSKDGYKPVIYSAFLRKDRNTKADIVLTAI